MDATLSTEREGQTIIVSVKGRIEGGSSATQFQEELQQAIGQDDRGMVLDCQELAYISSAGLRAIAIVINRVQDAGIRLEACRMNPPVRKVFEISGFDQLIGVHETREEACRAAEAPVEEV